MSEQIIHRSTISYEALERGKKLDFGEVLDEQVREMYANNLEMVRRDLEMIEYRVWLNNQAEGAD